MAWTVTGALVSALTMDEVSGVLLVMKRSVTRQPTEGTEGVGFGSSRVSI